MTKPQIDGNIITYMLYKITRSKIQVLENMFFLHF
jgi:hypothetical protein